MAKGSHIRLNYDHHAIHFSNLNSQLNMLYTKSNFLFYFLDVFMFSEKSSWQSQVGAKSSIIFIYILDLNPVNFFVRLLLQILDP